MGNPNKPKQFFYLGDKPILVHTLEKFCAAGCFDGILVLTPATWVQQTKDIIARHCPQYADAVNVIAGGAERNDTIMNAIRYFEDECQADDASIIVTHDAVRPFVSLRIIEDNIAAALAHGACDTVVPATDTIVEKPTASSSLLSRTAACSTKASTPQSFNMRELRETLESLTPEESAILTDACKAFVLRGKKVALVRGDVSNIKITYPQDLRRGRSDAGGLADAEYRLSSYGPPNYRAGCRVCQDTTDKVTVRPTHLSSLQRRPTLLPGNA